MKYYNHWECFGHCDGCRHCGCVTRDLDTVVFVAIVSTLAIVIALVVNYGLYFWTFDIPDPVV